MSEIQIDRRRVIIFVLWLILGIILSFFFGKDFFVGWVYSAFALVSFLIISELWDWCG